MEIIISQIHTLSTRNDIDLKKLRDFLRHEQESLKSNAGQIDQALQTLDPAQHTLGIAFLLAAQCNAGNLANQQATFAYVGRFLRLADEQQLKKASVPMTAICKCYAQMAIDDGERAMLSSIPPLRCAVEKLRPDPETLTPVHAEFLRVCLKAKAYHLGARMLDQSIFDIAMSNGSVCPQMTVASFLCYFYYGAMIRIGLKQYAKALQLLRVALTCPATCLSAIQADAFKKYALVSLKVHGELQPLPVYASHIVQRYAKSPSYVLDLAEAFRNADAEAALATVLSEKATQIQSDGNMGLAKQVVDSLQRHKVQRLTKTYLTLSIPAIAKELGLTADAASESKVEELLFDMISSHEIKARIDQVSGMVSFDEEDDEELDVTMAHQLEARLAQILELAARVSAFEQEVVSSEAYIRKTAALQVERSSAAALAFDSMDM